MTRPTEYDRQTSFALFSSENPGDPHNGVDIDAEFNAVKIALDETQDFLAGVTDSDGVLKRGGVGRAQLGPDITLGIAAPREWASGTAYVKDVDVVTTGFKVYVCMTSHTSGSVFDDANWALILDFSASNILDDGSVTTAKLADGAATVAKLADNAVETAKIDGHAVTNAKLADDAVDDRVLADGAVVAGKLAGAVVGIANVQSAIWGTGDVKLTLKNVADSGWVLADDGTIGDASSGASTRANADCEALFKLLWNNVTDTYAPVTGGRGASADVDWSNHKKIALTKMLGRSLASAGAGSALSARSLGQTVGAETVTLTTAQIPSHNHDVTDPGHTHVMWSDGQNYNINPGAGVGLPSGGSASKSTASATTGVSVQNTGGGGSHNNMQPTVFLNVMVKL